MQRSNERSERSRRPAHRPAADERPTHGRRGDHPEARQPVEEQPARIVEERTYVGPYGEEEHEVIDERGRHFWSFRPAPQYRYGYDWFGFGWFWWLILWLIIIGLIVWGWGWGY